MITKESFINIIDLVLQTSETQDKFEESIAQWFETYVYGFKPITDLTDNLIDILQKEMNDKYDTISWWIYDAPKAGKEKDNCTITLENGEMFPIYNPDDLYEYLTYTKELGE